MNNNMTEQQIMEALSALEMIEGTTSTLEKEAVLKDNKGNEALKKLLQLTYNPFMTFGIKKDPGVACMGNERITVSYSRLLTLTDELSKRELTGNLAIEKLSELLVGLTPVEYKWFMRVVQKDLKAGITDKTINKVFKGLIPSFTCALAHPFNEKKLPERFVGDPKFDGYRCLAFKYDDGRVELRSRNGHLLEGYAGIEKDVEEYLPSGFVYDGEITGRDMETAFNDIQKSAFKKASNKDGVLNIFDVVSIEEFTTDEFKVNYQYRTMFLDQITDILDKCRSLARVHQSAPLKNCSDDINTLMELHQLYVSNGYEGTMVKDLDALYKKDKSYNIMKIKDFYDIDLVVHGVYEGEAGTKYEGTLGGLIVKLSDEDIKLQLPYQDKKHAKNLPFVEGGVFEVGVGSGISDPDRHRIWKNPNEVIGKTITIKFQSTSVNQKGEHSLRFPTLSAFRDDK